MKMDKKESLLSAYVDGELTQQEAQRVRLMLEEDPASRKAMEEYKALREAAKQLSPDAPSEEEWEARWLAISSRLRNGVGWSFLGVGILILGVWGILDFLRDPSSPIIVKIGGGSLFLGLSFLLYSIVRERVVEAKIDKYQGVEK